MKMWDYSILSHTAKLNGGPQKYIEKISMTAYREAVNVTNRKWLKRFLIQAPFSITGAVVISQKGIEKIKQRLNKDTLTDNDIEKD